MLDVLLLSGGRGTRSENPDLPKSLQKLTPELRVVDTIASSLESVAIGKVVAVLGQFHEEQVEAFSDISWPGELVITSSIDLGTSHAVATGLPEVRAEWVAVIAADSALSFDFAALLTYAVTSGSDVVFSARFSNHPNDSDALILGADSRIVEFRPKGQEANGVVLSASGVVLVRRSALEGLPISGDFQKNLFDLVESQNLIATAWISRFYCRDTGTPERLAKARSAFTSGSAQFRGKRQIGAILIDRDGTLIPDLGDARQRVSREEFAPEISQAFLEANDNGVPIFIVTNQPGVAKAKITELDVERTISDIQLELSRSGAVFDDYRYCAHHPDKGWPSEIKQLKVVCDCRKPSGGMGLELANHHHFSLKKSWVIGDSDADQGFAEAIEASFLRVSIAEPDSVAEAIRKAIGEIRNAN
jgi:mannose-1-phosphate guanylyltransferase/phosphomannomutase